MQVVVAFEASADPWRTRQLVAERLAGVIGDFPEGTSPPLMTSAAGRLQEIQELVLEGPTVDPMRLRDHAVRVLVPRLQSVPGVARVELLGGEERQLQVADLAGARCARRGVASTQVLEALEGERARRGGGLLEMRDKLWFVTLGTLAATPGGVRRLPVHTAHGLVALGDLAEVREAPGLPARPRALPGLRGGLDAGRQAAERGDAGDRARGCARCCPSSQQALPEGMTLDLFYDQGELVAPRARRRDTALLARRASSSPWCWSSCSAACAAPLIVVAAPAARDPRRAIPPRLLGLGLNAMTLGGLAIAVGLLVDAGVIMVENLVHRLAEAPAGAAPRGRTSLSRRRPRWPCRSSPRCS